VRADAAGTVRDALIAAGARGLLVADENCPPELLAALPPGTRVLSNRWDLCIAARDSGLDVSFSDFELPATADLELIACRVPKERAVVRHLINRAWHALAPGGRLLLWGGKQTGIKTHGKEAATAFGGAPEVRKLGTDYLAVATRTGATLEALADADYEALRPLLEYGRRVLFTKPGLFGWNQIDPGSALLVDQLPRIFARTGPPASLLDLGCGYGYLSIAAHALGAGAITATDTCAAALLACAKNFAAHGIAGQVVPSDCADGIAECFDLVLCNPPFHRGFAADQELSARFFRAAADHLHRAGRALFVTHRAVPAATLARDGFRSCEQLAVTPSFQVYLLQGSRRLAS
jgi:16S rRNA (guanine1207-N2)-methyltransferase